MKKLLLILIVAAPLLKSVAQESGTEKYGKTFNLGAGIGYYGYIGTPVPVGTINYEFDVFRNFTLAPFIGLYSYKTYYNWGDPNKPYSDPSYRRYHYRSVSVPVGVKGTYYFDELFKAGSKWDFYAAASAGFLFRTVMWEPDYYGNRNIYKSSSPLYLHGHIGAEYHFNERTGIFLDLSSGVSTVGLAFHF